MDYSRTSVYLTSALKDLAIGSTTRRLDPSGHAPALAIGQAVQAIEESIRNMAPQQCIPIPQTLRTSAERTIRHARRIIYAAESCLPSDYMETHEHRLLSLEHCVLLLRREVVRVMRYEKIELRRPTGRILRPDSRSLRRTKHGLASFINRVCYAVTNGLGFYALPLLPLNVKQEASYKRAVCNVDDLDFVRSALSDWAVEPDQDIASSEVSTEVDEALVAEWERKTLPEDDSEPGRDENDGVGEVLIGKDRDVDEIICEKLP